MASIHAALRGDEVFELSPALVPLGGHGVPARQWLVSRHVSLTRQEGGASKPGQCAVSLTGIPMYLLLS